MDRQGRRFQSMDHNGQRTPLAWRHRDMNHPSHRRPSSPSLTSTSTDDRDEVPMVRATGGHRFSSRANDRSYFTPHPDPYAYNHRNGTLRSTRSVPALALATWDGEPCPVHGHGPSHFYPPGPQGGTLRRYGSMFDVRTPNYVPTGLPPPPHAFMLPPHMATLERKSFHGSIPVLAAPPHSYPMPPPQPAPVPPHFLPPMMRPRPFVIPAGAEPLPVRDPYKFRTPPPGYSSKSEDSYTVDQVCCKGHLIVLWIILGVVTVGVILGIILGITIS